jgi:hypothetical protein
MSDQSIRSFSPAFVGPLSDTLTQVGPPRSDTRVSVRQPIEQSAWLFGPRIDYLCAGSLTFLIFLPLLLLNMTTPTPAFVGTLLILGNVLVNSPHYAATYYRVYRSKDQILRYPIEAVVAPAGLALVAAACFVFPSSLTPWVAFAYLATSGYHYSGQTYGVSMIFLGKSGIKLTALQKRVLRVPIYAAYAYSIVNVNIAGSTPSKVKETFVPQLDLPASLLVVATVVVAVAVVMFLGLNLWFYRRNRRGLPPVVNIMVAAHVVWFTMTQFPILIAFVPFLHCLQYLFVTAFFDFKEQRARKSGRELTLARYFKSTMFFRYYATQVAVGLGLFVFLPLILTSAGAGPRALVGAVVISIINLHHFILDGAIWKLRSATVRQPLLT